VAFARENKVYWIVPLLLILALAAMIAIGAQGASPWIYPVT